MNRKPIALILTDTHLKPDNTSLVEDIFNQAIDKCHELNINTILHGGDWFTSRTGQPLAVLKATQRILSKLEREQIKTFIIPGNHDKTDQDSEDSFLDVFNSKSFEVIRDYDYIDIYEDDKKEENDITVHLLPYFKESGTYLERLKKIEPIVGRNILITHIAINGVLNNDGSKQTNAIPVSEFSKFDKVCVGHYHNQQQFENIHYIGSAYQSNYGEDDHKGFTILYNDGSIEFVQSNFPKFIKYEIDVSELTSEDILNLEKEKKNSNDNIRIKLKGDEAKVKSFDTSLLTQIGIDYELAHKSVSEPLSDEEVSDTITHNKESILKAFKAFCEKNKITDINYGWKKLERI